MDEDLVRGVARILDAAGGTAGTGFLVSGEGWVVTCAHVLAGHDEVELVFRDSAQQRLRARVAPEFLRAADAQDVAFLRLLDAIPEGVAPLALAESPQALGRRVRSFGYPQAMGADGMWAEAQVVGATQQGGHALLQLRDAGEITRGFSGGPVIELGSRRVVGMISAVTAADSLGRQAASAFVTPSETLREVFAPLQLAAPPAGARILSGLEGDPGPVLLQRCTSQNEAWLADNRRARRYLPETFGARAEMQAAIAAFVESDRTGFVLTGESGMGKTTLLCHLLEGWRSRGELVLAWHAQSLEIEQPLEERILLDLRLSADFMALVDWLQAARRRLVLLVDGVNEHASAARLLQQLSTFAQRYRAEAGCGLKLILSFRTAFLDRVIETLPLGERDEGRLFPEAAFAWRELTAAERVDETGPRSSYRFELGPLALTEIGAAYEAYRHYREPGQTELRHCPRTPFAKLDPAWHAMLAQPFYLRLLVEAYHGKAVPARPWHGEVMRAFCERRIWGGETDGNRFAERAVLVDELVAAMRRQQLASIRKEAAQALSPQWAFALRPDAPPGSAYRQLVEDGVLMETLVREPSGRGARTRSLIRFSFDTLFEYLLGDDLLREVGGWDGLDGARLGAEIERSRQFPYLAGAAEHLLLEAVDECKLAPLVELFGVLDGGERDTVYEALSPQLSLQQTPAGKVVFYDRTGTMEQFARLRDGRFIHDLLWKLYEWGDTPSEPLSTMAGTSRGRGRPSRWHRNFRQLFDAMLAGAEPRAAFNIVLWMAGGAGLMKDEQLAPLCQQTALDLRAQRIEAADAAPVDARAAVLLVQADALAKAGELDAAIDAAGQACDRLALAAPALTRQQADGLVRLAALQGRAGQHAQLVDNARAALQLLRALPPSTVAHKELLLNALTFEHQALRTLDADADTRALQEERLEVMRDLVLRDGVRECGAMLVDAASALAAEVSEAGDDQAATALSTEAVEMCRPVEDEPGLPDRLPRALVLRGMCLERAEDPNGAWQDWGEALAIWSEPAGQGDLASARWAIQVASDRCKLCAGLSRWDLVAADVVAAFGLFVEACNRAAEMPPKALLDSFHRLILWLRRLEEDDRARLYEALGPDIAEVVAQQVSGD